MLTFLNIFRSRFSWWTTIRRVRPRQAQVISCPKIVDLECNCNFFEITSISLNVDFIIGDEEKRWIWLASGSLFLWPNFYVFKFTESFHLGKITLGKIADFPFSQLFADKKSCDCRSRSGLAQFVISRVPLWNDSDFWRWNFLAISLLLTGVGPCNVHYVLEFHQEIINYLDFFRYLLCMFPCLTRVLGPP